MQRSGYMAGPAHYPTHYHVDPADIGSGLVNRTLDYLETCKTCGQHNPQMGSSLGGFVGAPTVPHRIQPVALSQPQQSAPPKMNQFIHSQQVVQPMNPMGTPGPLYQPNVAYRPSELATKRNAN